MKKITALSIILIFGFHLFSQEVEFISTVDYPIEIENFDRYDYRLIRLESNEIEDTIFRIIAPVDFKKRQEIGRVEINEGSYRLEIALRPVLNNYFENHKYEFEVNGKEKRVEVSFYFGKRKFEEIVVKRIYPSPKEIEIFPIGSYYKGEPLLFKISNNSDTIFYGQSQNGYFQGNLFRRNLHVKEEWVKINLGCYKFTPEQEKPLSKNSHVFSWIPDCRVESGIAKQQAPGEYKLTISVGEENYNRKGICANDTSWRPCKRTEIQYEVETYFTVEENYQLELRREIEKERLRILNELLDDSWEEYDDWDLYYWLKIDEKTIREVREKREREKKN